MQGSSWKDRIDFLLGGLKVGGNRKGGVTDVREYRMEVKKEQPFTILLCTSMVYIKRWLELGCSVTGIFLYL